MEPVEHSAAVNLEGAVEVKSLNELSLFAGKNVAMLFSGKPNRVVYGWVDFARLNMTRLAIDYWRKPGESNQRFTATDDNLKGAPIKVKEVSRDEIEVKNLVLSYVDRE